MATRNAFSAKYQDVNAVINGGTDTNGQNWPAAVENDTIIVPAGTETWTSHLVINTPIKLIGATTVNATNGTATDNTIIDHNLTGQSALIQVNTVLNKVYRISGFTFKDSAQPTATGGYHTTITGQSKSVRIDHCHYVLHKTGTVSHWIRAIRLTGGVYGVADHLVMDLDGTSPFQADNGNFGSNGNQGHAVWALPAEWSSENFFFIEDCHLTGTGQQRGLMDSTIGGKIVLRNNKIFDLVPSAAHGTEGGQGVRGNRATIIYGNTIDQPGSARAGGTRSGNVLFYNNTWVGVAANPAHFGLDYFREYTSFAGGSWKGASGTNAWDINETEGTATNVVGTGGYNSAHSSHLYASGTCANASGAGTDTQMKSSGTPGWTTNQWKNFSVRRVSDGRHSLIDSNTVDTLVLNGSCINGGCTQTNPKDSTWWNNGDAYEIRRPLIALDQSGRGQGDLLSGSSPSPVAWPHQQMEPCYSWNNRNPGGGHIDIEAASNSNTILENRDYYNEVAGGQQTTSSSPFNGTNAGVGWGTFANRPASGANGPTDITGVTANPPGTAYWATDVASVNGSTETGALYVWYGGAWHLYYQPHTYPHPLTTGAVTPVITSSSSVQFTAGTGGTFQATSSGFSSSPTWSILSGILPTGTTFSNGGLLTVGTSTVVGSYNFTIKALNGSESATQAFTLIVAAPTATRIIALSGSLAFGNVDLNTSSQKSFTITNNGNDNLTVTGITLPTGFVASTTSFTVAPGQSPTVTVTFTPTVAGAYGGTMTVTCNSTSGTNTMAVSGFGATRVIALSADLAFGDITTGQTATRPMTITNSGNIVLNVSAVAYPEGFSGDFTSGVIAAGGNKVVNITFSPTAAQAYSGTVDVTSDKTSGTNTMAASGTGTASATKVIQLTGSLDFGTVQNGTTTTKTLRITNSGNATLNVSGITYPTGFTGSYSGAITAGSFHDVVVTFSPVAATTYSGTVTVASDATGGINTTTASGTGSAASTKIIALSGDLAFGNVVVGGVPTRQFTIANTGTAPLAVSSITLPTGFTGSYSGTIAPGATQAITVTFSPTAVQAYSGNVIVTSDATSGSSTIATSGSGVAPSTKIIGVTGDLTFGNVQRHHSQQRIMVIANTGTAVLTVSGITFPTGFSGNWSSGTIGPGTSQNVTVTFNPSAVQSYGGDIIVASDKTSGVNTIACSGTGTNKKQIPFFLIVG